MADPGLPNTSEALSDEVIMVFVECPHRGGGRDRDDAERSKRTRVTALRLTGNVLHAFLP